MIQLLYLFSGKLLSASCKGYLFNMVPDSRGTEQQKLADYYLKYMTWRLHERSQSLHIYADLVNVRDQFSLSPRPNLHRHYDKTQWFFYEFANKCGHPLARSLHRGSTTTYIQKLKYPDGSHIYDQKDISLTFQQYYSILYNIRDHFHDMSPGSRSSSIKEYIDETMLLVLSSGAISFLEEAFTVDETKQTIADLPIGKNQ